MPRRVAVAVRLFTAGSVVGESGWKALSDEDGKLATGKINERFRTHHHELCGNSGFEGLNPALEALQAMVFQIPLANSKECYVFQSFLFLFLKYN